MDIKEVERSITANLEKSRAGYIEEFGRFQMRDAIRCALRDLEHAGLLRVTEQKRNAILRVLMVATRQATDSRDSYE